MATSALTSIPGGFAVESLDGYSIPQLVDVVRAHAITRIKWHGAIDRGALGFLTNWGVREGAGGPDEVTLYVGPGLEQ